LDAEHYLDDAIREFRKLKTQADRALAQVSDEDFFATLDAESNSIAVIVKHIAGNMRSRWTNFLTTDGEKPDRHRDIEFEIGTDETRDGILARWEAGWSLVFGALEPLAPEDAERQVLIRGEPHTVVQAINRQLTHYAGHVGQIVFLAKHFAADRWQTLSVPRGKSEELNARTQERRKTESR